MKLINLKKIIGVSAFGLAMIAGTTETNAQNRNRAVHHDQRAVRQDQRL